MPAVVPMGSLLTPSLPCEGAGQSGTASLFPRGDEMEATAHRLGGLGFWRNKATGPAPLGFGGSPPRFGVAAFWRNKATAPEPSGFCETKPPARSRWGLAKQSHQLGAIGVWRNKPTAQLS